MPRKPPVGKRFVKGQTGNPLGAGAHNKDLRQLRRITQNEVSDLGSLVISGDLKALQAIKDDPTSSVLKVWFSAIAIKAINKGDASALGILLDRIVGKVKDKVEVMGEDGKPITGGFMVVLKDYTTPPKVE